MSLDALLYLIPGTLLTWILWDTVAYGVPEPSREVAIAQYAATFVVAPALVLLAIGWVSFRILYRNPPVAFMLAAIPIPLWPIFLGHAIA